METAVVVLTAATVAEGMFACYCKWLCRTWLEIMETTVVCPDTHFFGFLQK
jgi:hypothetical protein